MSLSIKTILLGLTLAFNSQTLSAQTNEDFYASVRGWNVVAVSDDGWFAGCGMSRPTNGFDFALFHSVGGWEILVPTNRRANSRVMFDMDIDRASYEVSGLSDGVIASAVIERYLVKNIARGRKLSFTMDGQFHLTSLHGTTAAILKVEECVANNGNPPRPEPRAQPPIESDTARMGMGCPAYGSYRSPNVQDRSDVEFVNFVDHAVTVYWIDFDGNNVEMASLLPGESVRFGSYAGHHWIFKDFNATCFGGVWTLSPGNNYFEIR